MEAARERKEEEKREEHDLFRVMSGIHNMMYLAHTLYCLLDDAEELLAIRIGS